MVSGNLIKNNGKLNFNSNIYCKCKSVVVSMEFLYSFRKPDFTKLNHRDVKRCTCTCIKMFEWENTRNVIF